MVQWKKSCCTAEYSMRKKQRKKHPVRRIFICLFLLLFCLLFAACAFYGVKGYQMYEKAVTEKSISERVGDICGREDFTSYSELPQFYIDATISVEDHRFESHSGIDMIAIGRAVWADIKARAFVQGGSTITQQFAKNLLFTQEKKLERKAAEVFAALELESRYTKKEIFALYANTVYFGKGCYGIHQAAAEYFGKEPSELRDYECVVLAGLPNAPSVYYLDENKELISQRVEQVLRSMVRSEIITKKEADRIALED